MDKTVPRLNIVAGSSPKKSTIHAAKMLLCLLAEEEAKIADPRLPEKKRR
jgi:hypothetical protein